MYDTNQKLTIELGAQELAALDDFQEAEARLRRLCLSTGVSSAELAKARADFSKASLVVALRTLAATERSHRSRRF
jgi:hypothetical protein